MGGDDQDETTGGELNPHARVFDDGLPKFYLVSDVDCIVTIAYFSRH